MNEKELKEGYIKYRQERDLKPMTNSQNRFLEFLIENLDRIPNIGDMDSIFLSFRRFMRDNK